MVYKKMKYKIYRNDIDDNFIQAIKDFRSATGKGLKEAKEAMDELRYNQRNELTYYEPLIMELSDDERDLLQVYGFMITNTVNIELDDNIF